MRKLPSSSTERSNRMAPQRNGTFFSSRGTILIDRTQLQSREADRNVDGNRTLQRDRLQREAASRTADQDVNARAKAHSDVSRSTDVFAGQCSRGRAGGGR